MGCSLTRWFSTNPPAPVPVDRGIQAFGALKKLGASRYVPHCLFLGPTLSPTGGPICGGLRLLTSRHPTPVGLAPLAPVSRQHPTAEGGGGGQQKGEALVLSLFLWAHVCPASFELQP